MRKLAVVALVGALVGIPAGASAQSAPGPDSVTLHCIAGTTPASGDATVAVIDPRESGVALPLLNCTVSDGDRALAGLPPNPMKEKAIK